MLCARTRYKRTTSAVANLAQCIPMWMWLAHYGHISIQWVRMAKFLYFLRSANIMLKCLICMSKNFFKHTNIPRAETEKWSKGILQENSKFHVAWHSSIINPKNFGVFVYRLSLSSPNRSDIHHFLLTKTISYFFPVHPFFSFNHAVLSDVVALLGCGAQ